MTSELEARMRSESPWWWCRIETRRLQELLRLHVDLALESGTDAERVIAFLDRVREAVLNPNKKEKAA